VTRGVLVLSSVLENSGWLVQLHSRHTHAVGNPARLQESLAKRPHAPRMRGARKQPMVSEAPSPEPAFPRSSEFESARISQSTGGFRGRRSCVTAGDRNASAVFCHSVRMKLVKFIVLRWRLFTCHRRFSASPPSPFFLAHAGIQRHAVPTPSTCNSRTKAKKRFADISVSSSVIFPIQFAADDSVSSCEGMLFYCEFS
jgi:hypothetical protein